MFNISKVTPDLAILIAIILGLMRLSSVFQGPGLPAQVYKDLAHVFIGTLIVPAWRSKGLYRWLFWILCIEEIVVATVTHL